MAARITDEEWDKLSPENFETHSLLRAVDAVDDLAADLDEQVSYMMTKPEEIQDTLSQLTAPYPDSLCCALRTAPNDRLTEISAVPAYNPV